MKIEKKITKKFIKDELKKGTLFVLEKYLSSLAANGDWIDCISYIFFNGTKEEPYLYANILDEKDTENLMKQLSRNRIKLIIIKKEKENNYWWDCLLLKFKPDNKTDDVVVFFGGEQLRKYCDERNLYYGSIITEDGLLMSSTSLKLLKHEEEDCRIPLKNYKK